MDDKSDKDDKNLNSKKPMEPCPLDVAFFSNFIKECGDVTPNDELDKDAGMLEDLQKKF